MGQINEPQIIDLAQTTAVLTNLRDTLQQYVHLFDASLARIKHLRKTVPPANADKTDKAKWLAAKDSCEYISMARIKELVQFITDQYSCVFDD